MGSSGETLEIHEAVHDMNGHKKKMKYRGWVIIMFNFMTIRLLFL